MNGTGKAKMKFSTTMSGWILSATPAARIAVVHRPSVKVARPVSRRGKKVQKIRPSILVPPETRSNRPSHLRWLSRRKTGTKRHGFCFLYILFFSFKSQKKISLRHRMESKSLASFSCLLAKCVVPQRSKIRRGLENVHTNFRHGWSLFERVSWWPGNVVKGGKHN